MFADSGLSDEIAEKIVAFVDREAGRDAPLTADDEALVRRLIAEDPAARTLADELRATNAGLDTLLDDVAAVEVPDRLIALIRGHGTSDVAVVEPASRKEDGTKGDEVSDDGDVIALRQARPSARQLRAACRSRIDCAPDQQRRSFSSLQHFQYPAH